MSWSALGRKAAKSTVLPWGLIRRRRNDDVVILLYHRVGSGEREIDLPVDAFARQLELLAAHGDLLTLDQALEGRSGGVVLTFDDGFIDFHQHVLPLLVRHSAPALLYLATGLVANGKRDADSLTWDQLSEATSTGLVTIGAHTHSHADLSTVSEAVAADEMIRCKELIEDRLGTQCAHFSYPWSYCSAGADRAARRLFYSAALLWGTNRGGKTNRYRLGRTPVLRSDGPLLFRAKTLGMLDGEAQIYKLLRRGPWKRS
ncbi:MAG: polysaccharide deacetylase family protein [Actinomycetota bacterium]